jgi:hypothetical protein
LLRSRHPTSAGTWVLRSLGALLLADVAWLASASGDVAKQDPFQAAVGGLGAGHAVGVDWSFFAFDPRRAGTCENELFPLPGMHCPSPHHGLAVIDRPALDGPR